jgi:hypothetical protein
MFQSADNNTFGARAREVLATFAKMWLWMLAVVIFFKIIGFAIIGSHGSMPLLGVIANYLLDSHNLTLKQALVSPFAVLGVVIVIFAAPFVEEIIFRWCVCGSLASDDSGKLKPNGKGLGVVLAGSFIFFGLAHGFGYFSLMLQGVGGLLLAMLWFRNGHNTKASYFSCVAAHSLYNISVVVTEWIMRA